MCVRIRLDLADAALRRFEELEEFEILFVAGHGGGFVQAIHGVWLGLCLVGSAGHGHGGAMERVRPWDQGTRERNLADRLLKNRTWSGFTALHPGNWRTGPDGAGGGFRMNPADALMGWQAATVQVVGDTGMDAATFQICL